MSKTREKIKREYKSKEKNPQVNENKACPTKTRTSTARSVYAHRYLTTHSFFKPRALLRDPDLYIKILNLDVTLE